MNNISGEFKIKLLGQERVMKANFQAAEKLEKEVLKREISYVVLQASSYRISVTDIIDVIYVGLAANKDTRLKRDEIGEAVIAEGAAGFAPVVIEYLKYFLTGGKEQVNSDPFQ